MPTFRFHRGNLEESMKTCVVVKDIKELASFLSSYNKITQAPSTDEDKLNIGSWYEPEDLKIIPYIFDKRIGWNTHMVIRHPNCVTKDASVIGFLSDSFY